MMAKRIELYDIVSKICQGSEYSIGLHGIDYGRVDDLVGMDYDLVSQNILDTGLKIYHSRSINGTVQFFGRINILEDKEKIQEGLNTYLFGSCDYILVAVPVILKTEKGDKLFLGSPNLNTVYKEYIGTMGSEKTTLLEDYITDGSCKNNRVEPQYILGRFRVFKNNDIDLVINKNHIAFNHGLVSQEYYDDIKKQIVLQLRGKSRRYNIPIDDELFESIDDVDNTKIEKIIGVLEQNKRCNYSFCETLRQLENEKNLTKIIK